MALEKVLYTAQATATGGRDGKSESSDGRLAVKLSVPKGLGGDDGPGTNPEQLFAAGYSACFIGALKFVAGQKKIPLPADVKATADVGIGPIPNGFGIQVALKISIPGMDHNPWLPRHVLGFLQLSIRDEIKIAPVPNIPNRHSVRTSIRPRGTNPNRAKCLQPMLDFAPRDMTPGAKFIHE